MPTYLMLSTIGPEGAATVREHPRRIKEVNDEVAAMGVTVIAQYALLGEWDFLNILEAPDDATVARMSIELGARGTLKTQTIPAVPIDEFIARLEA
jgi:uncharacterized protein with GYD domain